MQLKVNNVWTQQFRKCQATIADFDTEKGTITIFYSYLCPKIVKFPNGQTFRFNFKNSRKEGAITESSTTSKQCNKRLGSNHRELNHFNLEDFERQYFDTRLENYGKRYY